MNNLNTYIRFRVDKQYKELLAKLAKDKNKTVSDLIRDAVNEVYIQQQMFNKNNE